LFGKTPLKAQNDYIFQKFGGVMSPFSPLATPMVVLPEIENQQGRKFDETCRVRICICKESKIKRNINDAKGGNKQKKQPS